MQYIVGTEIVYQCHGWCCRCCFRRRRSTIIIIIIVVAVVTTVAVIVVANICGTSRAEHSHARIAGKCTLSLLHVEIIIVVVLVAATIGTRMLMMIVHTCTLLLWYNDCRSIS